MDTIIYYNVAHDGADELLDACEAATAALEASLSATMAESEVFRFNESADGIALSDDTAALVGLALEIHGVLPAYDITVAPLVSLWNVAHAGDGWTPPSDDDIASALALVGAERLTLADGVLSKPDADIAIDLGGIGKGWALGKAASLIDAAGSYGTVSFGGNIAVIGTKADGSDWRVGVKNPADPTHLCAKLDISSGIVAVSGGYERYAEYDGKRYHHILDPQTGYPSDSDLASAAVWVPGIDERSGALCDALSTALFVMGREAALGFYESGVYEFEALLIGADGTITATGGLYEDDGVWHIIKEEK